MLSFQGQYTQCQDMAADTTSDALTFFKTNINLGQKILESEIGSYYTEESRDITTTASTSSYQLPENFIRLKKLYVTIGTVRYSADEVYDEDVWQNLQMYTSQTSDYLTKVFVRRRTFEVYPTPSTTSRTMTMIYEATTKDMTNADYTTGTITTLANAGTAVTGSGTTWTSAMIGRYFRVDADAQWYEISAVGSTTSLTLYKGYQGTAISAGSSTYTIGEVARTPETTHMVPVYYALWQWFTGPKKDAVKGPMYKTLFDQNMAWAKTTYGRRYSKKVIKSQRALRAGGMLVNPNYYPSPIS